MAIPHAAAGDVIDVSPFGDKLSSQQSATLVRTEGLQIVRLVLPAGKSINTHTAPGAITVHCLEGRVDFTALNRTQQLTTGALLFLNAGEPHSLAALEDSSLLVTLLLP